MQKPKLITQELINTELDKYDKDAFYDRIEQNQKELGYSSLYAYTGNTMLIHNLKNRGSIPNVKTLLTLDIINNVNGNRLSSDWLLYGRDMLIIPPITSNNTEVNDIRISSMQDVINSLKEQIKMQADLIEFLKNK